MCSGGQFEGVASATPKIQNVPLETAQQLSPELLEAIGYSMYDALGIYDPRVSENSQGPQPNVSSYRDARPASIQFSDSKE